MKPLKPTVLFAALALAASALAGDETSHWEKAYPLAEAGMTRHVLHLPSLDDESLLKVELIVGKTVETDGVNHYFYAGKIEEQMVEGWQYPRYNASAGPLGSTLMGVEPGQPKVNKFVTLGMDPYLIRYNSRLPVVVYAPGGFEVRYRIWKADPGQKPIDNG